tara:strand:- start:4500 stop:5348 length:849 start_codon:yes stop_codon:yes gene_type:complete
MRKFACITTFNKDYYDSMANKMVETYLQFWPDNIPLYCYTEDMKLPISSHKLKELDVYEACGKPLQEYLDYIGTHFSRGFAYKAFSWIHACRNIDADTIIYLDADSVTYRDITQEWLEQQCPIDNIAAYMGVTMNKGKYAGSNIQHADTGIYWFNTKHNYAETFVNRYEDIYLSRSVNDRNRFPKPNDAYVFADCVIDAINNGVSVVDFHPQRTAHSPLKETVLGKYFRHFKGARKKDPKMDKYIEKITTGAERKDLDKQEKKNKKHGKLKELENNFRTWKK